MRTARLALALVVGVLAADITRAGVITFLPSPGLSTDANSGISTSASYTHRVSGGEAVTVNGVSFDLLNPSTTPANFNWNTFSWSKDQVQNNNNNWNPATGGVTGTGVQGLLNDFTYSANGTSAGNHQAFTLSGLTTGTTYDARVYIRAWDVNYTGRLATLTYTNGAEVNTQAVSEDQPTVHGYPNNHSAYYINYRYTAQGPTMTIDAAVAAGGGGAFHMYALTNQVAADAPVPTGGTGPGGIERTDASSSLLYWLRADTGVVQSGGAVSAWNDQTTRANNFSQGTAGARPTLVPGVLNGQAVVRFDGADDRLDLGNATSPSTVFIVNRPSQYAWLAGIWGSDNTPTGGDKGIRMDPDNAPAWRHPGDGNDFTNGTGGTMYINGAATNTFSSYATSHILTAFRGASAPTTYNNTILGWYYGGRVFNGDIAEVVAYDRVLNTAERQVVENALSAKYSIPLAGGNVYTGDDSINGDYDLDVFGIGRVNATNYVPAAGAAGLGIMAALGTLDDGDWLLAGHKVPVNSDQGGLWQRAWYLDKTGSLDATLTFDFSDAGLIPPPNLFEVAPLLYYSETSGLNFSPLAVPGTVNGDRVSFPVPDALLRDGYYTLMAGIPEPTTLALLGLGAFGLLRRRRK
jgi:hypothetical protein